MARSRKFSWTASLCLAAVIGASPSFAEQHAESYSPHIGEDFPTNVYFGDTHVHSSWSADASNMGNRQLGPDDAYRFARGEEITAHNGMRVRLRRPLDFLLLSDHAEYLGVMDMLDQSAPDLLETEVGKRWAQWRNTDQGARVFAEFIQSLFDNKDLIGSSQLKGTVWSRVVQNADRWNDPGRFTAFIGYEWTAMPGGLNLHRNVLFADGADRAGRILPHSSFDGDSPESLWRFMGAYEEQTGGRVLAIPHNPNISGGLMFAMEDSTGKAIDAEYAAERARREPIVEVTQYKGDSETHPVLSPNDEFANYETWDRSIIGGEHKKSWFEGEYARSALRNGLRLESKVGRNPFKFGMIGSTDAHTSMATAAENNFWGKATFHEPSKDRWQIGLLPEEMEDRVQFYEWEMAASGYAAIWARENTREALFDALMRRETYATTGPRMTVRFFGGFDYTKEDALAPNLARVGYGKGVPMGGDLSRSDMGDSERAPAFLVAVLKDPEGANLDRIQIVKGWVEAEGETQERVYDVAVSDGRWIGGNGRAKKSVGSTVDLEKVGWTNSIGAASLVAYWSDPDFDPEERAFYYVRAIEIPKPRWTAYDRRYFGSEMADEVPMTTQDRAYTSPIWYTP